MQGHQANIEHRRREGEGVLSVDIVAAKMLGLEPSRIEHLRLIAEDRGLKLDEASRQVEVLEQ